jgi:hypothetical protein
MKVEMNNIERIRIGYKSRKTFEQNRKDLSKSLKTSINKLQKEEKMLKALYNNDLPTKMLKELINDINIIQAKIIKASGYMQAFFNKETEHQPLHMNPARQAMREALMRVEHEL